MIMTTKKVVGKLPKNLGPHWLPFGRLIHSPALRNTCNKRDKTEKIVIIWLQFS